MLAYTTNTWSMRGCAVFLSLKSWASKLHQQLPLSPKESQRLLTALTGSFRRHLDEVHPPAAAADSKPKGGHGAISKAVPRALHSSAASADKHLASILTSPLLAKGSGGVIKADQDFAKAKVELQKDAAKDPITLLEEYDTKGTATIPIARLCLEKFEESLVGLSVQKQKQIVDETEPGRRTLLWLWRSELHQSKEFADNPGLIDLLTSALMRESLDKYLWQWISLDMVSASAWNHRSQNRVKEMYHLYRWKGRILRQMIQSKLQPPYGQKANLDDALGVYFDAVTDKLRREVDSHMRYLPTHSAGSMLQAALTHKRLLYGVVDPERYDRFKTLTASYQRDSQPGNISIDANKAIMDLWHPHNPTGLPMLHVLRRLLATDVTPDVAGFFLKVKFSGSGLDSRVWFSHMVNTGHQLRLQGYSTDADWVRAQIRDTFPALERFTENNLGDLAKGRRWVGGRYIEPPQQDPETSEALRVPFPTFT